MQTLTLKAMCQDFQPSIDPKLDETTTLYLNLSSPNHKESGLDNTNITKEKPSFEKINKKDPTFDSNLDLGCWNFLHFTSQTPQEISHTNQYSSSSPTLSEKSLELCTENLGSETGTTDTMDTSIFSLLSTNAYSRSTDRKCKSLEDKKSGFRDFPPPLTTMGGSDGVHRVLRPHREGGRLIITVESSPRSGCFHVERSHGRLRLCILKNFESDFDSESRLIDDNEEEEEEGGCEENFEEDEVDEEDEVCMREDMSGNSLDVGGKMGIEKFQRPRWCMEGRGNSNKGLCNWEPMLVASS